MTKREKVLATTLVGMLGLMVSAGVLYVFVYKPLEEVALRIQAAKGELHNRQEELANEQKQVDEILRLDPRLSLWNELSLPPRDTRLPKGKPPTEEQKRKHINHLQVEYDRYLSELLRKNRFRPDSIVVTSRPAEQRGGVGARSKQKPTSQPLVFSVVARGTLKNVTDMLKEFYATPLLHQVRNLNVDLVTAREGRDRTAPPGTLELKMTVEALMVFTARERDGLMPSKLPYPPRVLAEPERRYALMDRKNMFTGIAPPPPPARSTEEEEKPKQKEDPREVLRFVKLTMLCYDPELDRWEATLYDQAKGGPEKRIGKRPTWRAKFTILDKYDEKMLEGQVVHIDERGVVFRSEDKFYRLRCGDFLYPAIRTPLKGKELKELEELGVDTAPRAKARETDSDE